ncbi:TetR/AcrR family transcriptional regulator [Amycolatopsis marina]|uniref:TetR/AcrR family transcriptional regulator n=1 Tax=Amycolatopsis marina TaxID=490629 RepID=UPI0015A670B9|nr:TetR/AcrR family transcriptional regulator [Amycolatopsis marina]
MPEDSRTADRTAATDISDGRTTRWAGQRAKRRAEFVDAAVAAIALHGPGVSTEQIAAQAGVARPRLYRHFEDADDLYRAVGHRAAEMLLADMAPVLTEPTGSARTMTHRAVHTFVRWLAQQADLYRYVAHRATASAAGHESVVADIKQAIAAQVGRLLAAYLEALGASSRLADPLSFGVVGMVEATTNRWLDEPGDLTLDDLVESLTSWLWGTFDQVLSGEGATLGPDDPLPPLPGWR